MGSSVCDRVRVVNYVCKKTSVKGAESRHTCTTSLLVLLLLLLLLPLLSLLITAMVALLLVKPSACGCFFRRGDGTFIVEDDCINEEVTAAVVW